MTRICSFVLVILVTSTLACQSTNILSAYISASPTPTLTRAPSRPAASPPAALPPTPPTPTAAPAPPTTPPEITGTVTENSRVRASPSTSAAILARLNKGDQTKVVGRNAASDWYEIPLPGDPNTRGWISAELVQLQGSADDLPVVQPGSAPPANVPPTPRAYP